MPHRMEIPHRMEMQHRARRNMYAGGLWERMRYEW